jgi:hypothetical protein
MAVESSFKLARWAPSVRAAGSMLCWISAVLAQCVDGSEGLLAQCAGCDMLTAVRESATVAVYAEGAPKPSCDAC